MRKDQENEKDKDRERKKKIERVIEKIKKVQKEELTDMRSEEKWTAFASSMDQVRQIIVYLCLVDQFVPWYLYQMVTQKKVRT